MSMMPRERVYSRCAGRHWITVHYPRRLGMLVRSDPALPHKVNTQLSLVYMQP
jgi:hypothetical protein